MNKRMAANLVARVEARILLLRGQRVMLSPHLAELYEVRKRSAVSFQRSASEHPADLTRPERPRPLKLKADR